MLRASLTVLIRGPPIASRSCVARLRPALFAAAAYRCTIALLDAPGRGHQRCLFAAGFQMRVRVGVPEHVWVQLARSLPSSPVCGSPTLDFGQSCALGDDHTNQGCVADVVRVLAPAGRDDRRQLARRSGLRPEPGEPGEASCSCGSRGCRPPTLDWRRTGEGSDSDWEGRGLMRLGQVGRVDFHMPLSDRVEVRRHPWGSGTRPAAEPLRSTSLRSGAICSSPSSSTWN